MDSKSELNSGDLQDVARIGYADMLHDDARNVMYRTAIRETVSSFKNQPEIRPLRVVDIGTGTGLLSMMAVEIARESDIPIIVTAFEYFPPMAECARRVIRDNGYEKEITVIGMKSDSHSGFKDEEKADILITELFDTELIGEGALPSYRHAIKNFMKPQFVAVPSKAIVWAQVVESEELVKYNQFRLPTNITLPQEVQTCPGSGILHDFQLSQLVPDEDLIEVGQPKVAFEFDFESLDTLELCGTQSISLEVDRKGVKVSNLVVFFWWELRMSHFDCTTLSLIPRYGYEQKLREWREHWIQAVYYPTIGNCDVAFLEGQSVTLNAYHDAYSFWFSWDESKPLAPRCSCRYHDRFSRSRVRQLNDTKRLQPLLEAVQSRQSLSLVKFVGSFSFLPVILELCPDTKVHCTDDEEVYQGFSKANCTSQRLTTAAKVDLVVAEPYFSCADLPSDLLEFWFRCMEDPSTSSLSDDQIIPSRVVFKCVLVEFDDLWKIRSEVGQVLGFNLEQFDKLILGASNESDEDFESQPLWEYPGKATMVPVTVFDWKWSEFSEFEPSESIKSEPIQLNNVKRETLLVYWTEFYDHDKLISSSGPKKPIETGSYIEWDRTMKQGVCFISGRKKVGSSSRSAGDNSSITFRLVYDLVQRKLKLD